MAVQSKVAVLPVAMVVGSLLLLGAARRFTARRSSKSDSPSKKKPRKRSKSKKEELELAPPMEAGYAAECYAARKAASTMTAATIEWISHHALRLVIPVKDESPLGGLESQPAPPAAPSAELSSLAGGLSGGLSAITSAAVDAAAAAAAAASKPPVFSVLSVGCGDGEVDIDLIKALSRALAESAGGAKLHYVGLEPNHAHAQRFRARLAEARESDEISSDVVAYLLEEAYEDRLPKEGAKEGAKELPKEEAKRSSPSRSPPKSGHKGGSDGHANGHANGHNSSNGQGSSRGHSNGHASNGKENSKVGNSKGVGGGGGESVAPGFRSKTQFDLVVLSQVMGCFREPQAALQRVLSQTRPGGRLLLVQPASRGVPELQKEAMRLARGSDSNGTYEIDELKRMLAQQRLPYTLDLIDSRLNSSECLARSSVGVQILSHCLECDLRRLCEKKMMRVLKSCWRLSLLDDDGQGYLDETAAVFVVEKPLGRK